MLGSTDVVLIKLQEMNGMMRQRKILNPLFDGMVEWFAKEMSQTVPVIVFSSLSSAARLKDSSSLSKIMGSIMWHNVNGKSENIFNRKILKYTSDETTACIYLIPYILHQKKYWKIIEIFSFSHCMTFCWEVLQKSNQFMGPRLATPNTDTKPQQYMNLSAHHTMRWQYSVFPYFPIFQTYIWWDFTFPVKTLVKYYRFFPIKITVVLRIG